MGGARARAGDVAGAARAIAQPPARTGRRGDRGSGRARRLRRPPLGDSPVLPLQPAPHAVARPAGPPLFVARAWQARSRRDAHRRGRLVRRARLLSLLPAPTGRVGPDHPARAVHRLGAGPGRRADVGLSRSRRTRSATRWCVRSSGRSSPWGKDASRPASCSRSFEVATGPGAASRPLPGGCALWAWDTRTAWFPGARGSREAATGLRDEVRDRLADRLGVFYR